MKEHAIIHIPMPLPVVASPVATEETDDELQVAVDEKDKLVTSSSQHARHKSVVVIPARSSLTKRAHLKSGTSSSRHPPT